MENKQQENNKKFRLGLIGTVILIVMVLFLFVGVFYILRTPATTTVVEPICGNAEHLHTAECFDQPVEISFICGKEEHTHGDDCFDEEGNLICLKEEHTHDGTCMQAVATATMEDRVEEIVHGEVDVDNVTLPETSLDNETEYSEDNSENEPSTEDLLSESKSLSATGPIDFSQFITDVSFQVSYDDINYKEYNPQTDPLYTWQHLKFTLNYEIPAYELTDTKRTITYQIPYNVTVESEMTGKVFNLAGRIIGDYTIDQSGTINIVFNDDYVNKNKSGETIYGDVSFSSSVSNFETKKDGNIEFIFTDDLRIKINVADKTNKSGDLYVKKTQSELTPDGFIDYTIKVYTKEGTSDVINLTDTMNNMVYDSALTVKDAYKKTIDVSQPQSGSSNFSLQLPKLDVNNYYTITYRARLAKEFEVSTYLENGVKATSKDSQDNEVETSTSVSTYYSVNLLEKTGELVSDGINWTITVNKDHANIGGFTLTDYFNNEEFTGPVKITSASSTNTANLPITFEDGDTNTYIISYKTGKDKMYGSDSAFNKATLIKGEKTYTAEKYVYIDGTKASSISKTAKSLDVDDAGNCTLTWHISANFNETMPAGKEISDFTSSTSYFTAAQVKAFLSNFDKLGISYTYKLYGKDGWYPEYTSIAEDAVFGSIRITFNEPIKAGTKLEFDYQTTSTLEDKNKEQEFVNKFTIDNISSDAKTSYKPLLIKYDPTSQSNPSSHILTEDRLIKWSIDFTVPNAPFTLKEIIPEGTTVDSIVLHEQDVPYELQDGCAIMNFENDFINLYKDTTQLLQVTLRINDDFAWKKQSAAISTGTFENKIIMLQNGNEVAQSKHTQVITNKKNDEEIKVIEKSYDGAYRTDVLPYTLEVNKTARNFSDDNFLKVTDILKYNGNSDYVLLYLAPDSVEAFEVLEDGSTRKLSDDEFKYTYTYDISKAASTWGKCTNTLSMQVPDEMHVRIKYSYRVNGKADSNVWYSFSNSTSVTNTTYETEGSSVQTSISISKSNVTAHANSVDIYKVDSKTRQPLAGVYFRLYKYTGSTYELVTFENNNDLLVTNENGIISIRNLQPNTAYYLEEVLPLENYLKMQPFYFMVHDDDTNKYEINKPDDFNGEVYRAGMDIFVENEKPATSVHVEKVWTDGNGIVDGKTGTSATINLYRVEQSDEDYNNGVDYEGVVSLSSTFGPNKWHTFDNLTENSQYIAGTKMRLTLRYHDMWWSPDITVLLNDEPLGGTKNGTYVERQYDCWSRNELQYMEYVYEFTLDKKSAISVYLNTSSADNWDIDLEAIEIPEKNTDNLSSNPYKTVMLNAANNWQYTWEDLPQVGTSQDGEIIHYTYYIKEENLPGYESEIELISNTDEYSSYVVTNKRTTQSGFTMPATGSSGLWFVYIVGAFLALIAFVIFVRFLVKLKM